MVGQVAIGTAPRQRADEERQKSQARIDDERSRQERAHRTRVEKARRTQLPTDAAAWDRATRLRHFIAAAERQLVSDRMTAPGVVQA